MQLLKKFNSGAYFTLPEYHEHHEKKNVDLVAKNVTHHDCSVFYKYQQAACECY